jgi:hypothetical protein
VGADVGALAAIFGTPAPDWKQSPARIIAYMNQHGGIDGHKIVPVYVTVSSSSDKATAAQQVCAALTQDNKVDIELSGADDVLAPCLRQHGISAIGGGVGVGQDTATLRQQPNVYSPDTIPLDVMAAAEIRYAASHGVLKRGSRLGVLVDGCPAEQRVLNGTVKPLANRLGISVTVGAIDCVTNLVSGLVQVKTQASSAVLKFKTTGVTTVMTISPVEAYALASFSQTAVQQRFYPRYLLDSTANLYNNTQPNATIKFAPAVLPQVIGFGSSPLNDVGPLANPVNKAQRAAQARCKQADPGQGITTVDKPANRYFDLAGFYGNCDMFFVMKEVLEANGLRFGLSDIAHGFATVLARGVPAAGVTGGRLGTVAGTPQVGTAMVRPFGYDRVHHRLHYIGEPFKVG